MRLTTSIRDAFVDAAMADVPEVDYRQQMRALALQAVVSGMPAKMRAVWDDPVLSQYLMTEWTRITDCVHEDLPEYPGVKNALATVQQQIDALHKLHHEQAKAHEELASMLRGAANGCNTTKQLAEALPAFAKYLPAENGTTPNLPALTGIVDKFVAAGWRASHAS